MTYAIESHIKPPKRRKVKAQPDNVAKAMVEYGVAYKAVYGVSPAMSYCKINRMITTPQGAANLHRVKELTRMLKARVDR